MIQVVEAAIAAGTKEASKPIVGAAMFGAAQLFGPSINWTLSNWRLSIVDYNDAGRQRDLLYRMNRLAAELPPANASFAQRSNHTPFLLATNQLLSFLNACPWHLANDNPAQAKAFWRAFQNQLKANGVRISLIDTGLLTPAEIAQEPDDWQSRAWYRLFNMSSSGPGLGAVIRDYYRSRAQGEAGVGVSEDELNWNFQRQEVRRKEDRERLMLPYHSWSMEEAQRLRWIGAISQEEFELFLKSVGVGRPIDQDYAALLMRRMPTAEMLSHWANRDLWNEGFAERYQLDTDLENSPVATFFARKQGMVNQPALPDQPAGETDWWKLLFRAKNEMPSFHECLMMQRRLREDPANPGQSIIPGVPIWTLQDTINVQKMKGLTPYFSRSMIGALVYEPLNLRFINHLLLPFLEHPEFRARWEPVIGPPEKWVAAAMADHGYRPEICDVAAAGLIQQGQDHADLEKKNSLKGLRADRRKQAIDEYEAGVITLEQAIPRMVDRWYTDAMAAEELGLVNRKIDLKIQETKIKEIRHAFMRGVITLDFASEQLREVGVTQDRNDKYTDLWRWERNEEQRTLTTAQILRSFKEGLMTMPQAQARLINLGWSNSDSLLQTQRIQVELQQAQARHAQEAANHAAAQNRKAQADDVRQRKAAAKERERLQKESERREKLLATAPHEQRRASADYASKVHNARIAWERANESGNAEKESAILAGAIEDYEAYLIAQIKLRQKDQAVESAIGPVDYEMGAIGESVEDDAGGSQSSE